MLDILRDFCPFSAHYGIPVVYIYLLRFEQKHIFFVIGLTLKYRFGIKLIFQIYEQSLALAILKTMLKVQSHEIFFPTWTSSE